MMNKSIRYVGGIQLAFLFLGACSQNTPVGVSFEFPDEVGSFTTTSPPSTSLLNAASDPVPVSETGLIKSSRMCYLIHVTGPGINIADDRGNGGNSASCVSSNGFGKFFGPYTYGTNAVLQIPAGLDRKFDLIGFVNPTTSQCDPAKFKMIPDGDGPRLIYGNKEIESFPGSTPIPGITPASAPSDKIYAFRSSPKLALTPGASVVVPLIKHGWLSDMSSPKGYGCGGDNNSKYVRIESPFDARFEENQVPNCNGYDPAETAANLAAQKHTCIHSGFVSGPIKLKCSEGTAKVYAEEDSDISKVLNNTATQTTLSCDASGYAQLLVTSNGASPTSLLLNPSTYTKYIRLTPIDSADTPQSNDSYIAVFRYSTRYRDLEYFGATGYVPHQAKADGEAITLKSFIGAKKYGSNRSVYFKADDSSPTTNIYKLDFVLRPEGATTRPMLAGTLESHYVTTGPVSLTRQKPNFDFLGEDGFSLLGLFTSTQLYTRFLNTKPTDVTYGPNSSTSTCESGTFCPIVDSAGAAINPGTNEHLATDGESIVLTEDAAASLSITADIFRLDNTNSLGGTAMATPINIELSPFLHIARTILGLKVDAAPTNKVAVAYYEYDDVSIKRKLSIKKCPDSNTGDFWDTCAPPTVLTPENFKSFDISVSGPSEKYIVGVHGILSNDLLVGRWKAFGTLADAPEKSVNGPSFNPPLSSLFTLFTAGTPTGWAIIPDGAMIRSLSDPKNGITSKQLLLSFSMQKFIAGSSTSNFMNVIYRSPDLGETWYLVYLKTSTMTPEGVMDAVPVMNYNKYNNSYSPAFLLMQPNKFLVQDWMGY